MVRTRARRRDRENEPGNFRPPGFGEPPGGMTPINDTGFYRTPDEPADPQDCERYPDSPWCGGNPFTLTPLELEPSIVLTECDIGIRFDGSFAFIKMPPVGLTYRRPECRETETENLIEVPQDNGETPSLYLPNIPYNEIVFVFLNWQQSITAYRFEERFYYSSYESREYEYTRSAGYTWNSYICPGRNETLISPDGNYSLVTSTLISGSGNFSLYNSFSRVVTENDNEPKHFFTNGEITKLEDKNMFHELSIAGGYIPHRERVGQGLINAETYTLSHLDRLKLVETNGDYTHLFGSLITFTPPTIMHGKWGKIVERLQEINRSTNRDGGSTSNTDLPRYTISVNNNTTISIAKIIFANCQTQIPISPPPLLPEPPMTCCPDDLIRLLIQKVDRLSEVVGIDEYPATVPETFVSERGGFLGELIPVPNTQIPSLTKFLEWYVKRFDELMGQWEIPIQVKDSDPTTPGDQKLGFNLPNLAEAVAEMMLLLLQISINSETLLNMNTRTMIEVGQDKQQNFKSYMLMDAIADYLGFKYEEKKHKLPMMFTVNKEDYAELLKENETEVVAAEYNDKQNLQETLHRLLEGAAITKAANFRKLNVNGDMVKQIIDLIKNYSKINKQSDRDDDFDTFVEDTEVGFTNTPGVTDTTHPYGRDYSQRPRIREIGNTSEPD